MDQPTSANLFSYPRRLNGQQRIPHIALLDSVFHDFIGHIRMFRGHSFASIRGYTGTYKSFRKYLLQFPNADGSVLLDISTIESWIAWTRSRDVSEVTINTYYRQLRPFFHYLEEHEGLANPFKAMKAPRLPRTLPKARTPEECRRILDTVANYPWSNDFVRDRNTAMITTILYTGLRKSELLRLKVRDIDLEQRTIMVNKGKGPAGGTDRLNYIPEELYVILDRYLKSRRARRYVTPELFIAERSGQVLPEISLRRIVDEVRRASGIPFSIHRLRHSYITMLLRAGTPIHIAAALAGHQQITTTAGYLRAWDGDQRAAQMQVRY
jgi:integrase